MSPIEQIRQFRIVGRLSATDGQPHIVESHDDKASGPVRAISPSLSWSPTGGDAMQAQDFTLLDQNGVPWTLSEHLDTARIVVFLRGDW
jgi:hypothetical protein